jgi:hypothetical protein
MIDPCAPPPSETVVLYGARVPLLVLHTAASIVLLGASTHHVLVSRHLLGAGPARMPLVRTYAKVIAVTYPLTLLLGALLYPAYRVHVRGFYLDRYAPEISALFDVKEIYAALTMVIAIGLGFVAVRFDAREDRALAPAYVAAGALVALVVWLDAIAGVIVVAARGVG